MKDTDGLNDGWKGLVHVMQSDARFTADEKAGLAAADAILDADGETTIEQDMLVLMCMKRLFSGGQDFY